MSAAAAPGRFRSTGLRVAEIAGVGVVIVLALVAVLTALRTELPRSPGVMSDALGPDPGERVDDYLARAEASLAAGGGRAGDQARAGGGGHTGGDDDEDPVAGPDAPRWALVSAAAPWAVPEAADVLRGVPRVSGLFVQVPVEGVAMPVTAVTTAEPVAGEPDRRAALARGLEQVADRLDAGSAPSPGPADASPHTATPGTAAPNTAAPGALTPPETGVHADRAAAAGALTAARIRAGAPAIVGAVVRGTPEQLRAVAGNPAVRGVEALPSDAVWGRFAVRPLLPQQREAAAPLPDGAPVPAA